MFLQTDINRCSRTLSDSISLNFSLSRDMIFLYFCFKYAQSYSIPFHSGLYGTLNTCGTPRVCKKSAVFFEEWIELLSQNMATLYDLRLFSKMTSSKNSMHLSELKVSFQNFKCNYPSLPIAPTTLRFLSFLGRA